MGTCIDTFLKFNTFVARHLARRRDFRTCVLIAIFVAISSVGARQLALVHSVLLFYALGLVTRGSNFYLRSLCQDCELPCW